MRFRVTSKQKCGFDGLTKVLACEETADDEMGAGETHRCGSGTASVIIVVILTPFRTEFPLAPC